MGGIVCKFGGTSMADAGQIRKVVQIIRSDPKRRYIVVSAPGKRDQADQKITDLLYSCHELASQGRDLSGPLRLIKDRYLGIGRDLGIGRQAQSCLAEFDKQVLAGASRDFFASRGEYLCARLLAEHLGAGFVDPEGLILIGADGRVDDSSYSRLGVALQGDGLFIVPGFYGTGANGKLRTFSRGGSDITGAVVARAVAAAVYENWTDVSGFLMVDPRLVPDPKPIEQVSYREMRELAVLGAQVLHEDSIYPVLPPGIPINIRNTNDPRHQGTMILPSSSAGSSAVVGITGKKGLAGIKVRKARLNQEPELCVKYYQVLHSRKLQPLISTSGVDAVATVASGEKLQDNFDALKADLLKELEPQGVELLDHLAVVAAVGESLLQRSDVTSRIFSELAARQIDIWLTEAGASGISLTVAVREQDFVNTIQAIYHCVA